MTIQLPVLLWTVICFAALVLILDRLLFRPLLAFMDRRAARVAAAKEKAAAAERAAAEAEARRAELQQRAQEESARLSEETITQARAEAKARLAAAEAEAASSLEAAKTHLGEESALLDAALEKRAETLAAAYLSALTN